MSIRVPHFSRRAIVRYGIPAALLVVVVAELIARFALGLGDPPLFITHPTIEYLYAPAATYSRFGNIFSVNAYSMRSDDFPPRKSVSNEFRILVMGDSVVNGGVLTDQHEIATELLRARLQAQLDRPVVVGNIATGSWGPPNLLAYARQFGFFDADVIIIVMSSHDHVDALNFHRLGQDMPTRTPVLAIQEALQRYLPRYVPMLRSPSPPERTAQQFAADQVAALAALRELLHISKAAGAQVHLVQHLELNELQGEPMPGFSEIAHVARQSGVPLSSTRDAFSAARAQGQQPYRDDIHPNALGQQLMADHFQRIVMQTHSHDNSNARER